MLSFWEKESFVHYDYLIVGGGIVGLSTALSLRERDPSASIVVLERGVFPTGASTKNAGFACFGSLTELLSDIQTIGENKALELVRSRLHGLKKLRGRLGDDAIDYRNYGGYELLSASDLAALDKLNEVNNWLSPLFQGPVFEIDNDRIKDFNFNTTTVKALVFNPYEGQIDTGKMMQALISLAQKNGINILTGTEVVSLEQSSYGAEVTVQSIYKTRTTLYANKVGLCTNAFTKELLPAINLNPGRGVVLVTRPITGLRLKGTFHMDQGYYYFRNFKDRVIFGGARNLFLKEEQTTDFDINEKVLDALKQQLDNVILPEVKYEVDHTWTGIMAFGRDKQPILKQHTDSIFTGVRLGGMGVAIGSNIGEELASMMCPCTP
ncbi:FAD-binding oxidoreductase [Fulvivirga sp. M361]|uniref:NAD(P)/FAD-dependent oxidoreductase n=1 Tax=Fulvivirga sp. M361 TaxID=2594266 RepID=UPI00117ADE13|nr:FAD-dependent oxidoreductase [Fulvivirga sp. M361]TRX57791.1 FAD-binding oxidoreductase [Fulvivirga sp. M361]